MLSKKSIAALFIIITFALSYYSCSQQSKEEIIVKTAETVSKTSGFGLEKLSEYQFFSGKIADLIPVEGILPYTLNTPLFSDYAEKLRFLKLPEGEAAHYNDKEVFDFPVGTVLIKNFLYPNDFRDETKGRRIMETRLLIHEEAGWKALPYIWNDAQTEAFLEIAGGRKEVSWIHHDGSAKQVNYAIPNVNQCKGCHIRGSKMVPIGPSARQLNGTFAYHDGEQNQLLKWQETGMLTGLPDDLAGCPKVPVWDDPASGSLTDRARAYLDINCAHCHRDDGPGNTSGMFLTVHETNNSQLGFYKAPIAAGRGSGNLSFGIVPGSPEESILVHRMESTDPGVMMPELGRKLIHDEGVKLVADWIASLNPDDYQ